MNRVFAVVFALTFAAQFNLLSAQTTVMRVWKNGEVTSSISTADVDSVTFETSDGVYLINGHRFVDLGLPSGLLWAETNIGAETFADDGDYFAWGETASKSSYSWLKYKYGQSSSNITKYNEADRKTVLDKEDDAAYVNWGSSCRLPTVAEFCELVYSDNCTATWTCMKNSSDSIVNGYKITSKKNGNSIFLPASGYRDVDSLYGNGSHGRYWTCEFYTENLGSGIPEAAANAYFFWFQDIGHITRAFSRYLGYPARPVAEP